MLASVGHGVGGTPSNELGEVYELMQLPYRGQLTDQGHSPLGVAIAF